jgi:hypothetical protein
MNSPVAKLAALPPMIILPNQLLIHSKVACNVFGGLQFNSL